MKEGDEGVTRARGPLNENRNNGSNEKVEEKENSFKNDQPNDKKEDSFDKNITNEEKDTKTTNDDVNNMNNDGEGVVAKRPDEVGEDDDATDEN